MKYNVGALQPNWKFALPSGQIMTVVESRPVDGVPGYSEVETIEPYTTIRKTYDWFTAPTAHRVDVVDCPRCWQAPGEVLDTAMPKTTFGEERYLCRPCMTAVDNSRYNTEHFG